MVNFPTFELVGLAQAALKEARERVKSAIKNSGYDFPNRKIIVNLAPADLKKEGSHFDLAIALGILIASEQLLVTNNEKQYFAGELSLDGSLRQIPGVLPMCLELLKSDPDCIFIAPPGNSQEAGLVNEVYSLTANNLREVCDYLEGMSNLPAVSSSSYQREGLVENQPDFADVKGQETAKRGMQVAAAGSHNILLIENRGKMVGLSLPTIFFRQFVIISI